jgi:hypothetical protein
LLVHPGKPMSDPYREGLKRLLIQNEFGKEDYLDFQNRCVQRVGPAAGIFMRQLLYWTCKQHDPEGWIYKTQSEMQQETGLTRRKQEKARKILSKYGVLKEDKRGVPCRLWYWVDLEALLRFMETPHSTMNQWKRKQDNSDAAKTADEGRSSSWDSITEHTDEVDSTIPAREFVNIDPASEYGNSIPTCEDGINGRAITESTSETTAESSSDNYVSENRLLQSREGHVSRGSTANKGVEMTNAPKPSVGGLELNRIYNLLTTPGSKAHGAYTLYLQDSLSLPDLANEVCLALTGSRKRAELYIQPVRRMVAELAIDEAAADQPIRAE